MKNQLLFSLVLGLSLLASDRTWSSPLDLQWRYSGVTNDLLAVTSGGGLIVAVGRNGTILSSIDTVTWTAETSNSTNDLRGVTYGNGLFIAVGGTSSQEMLTSTNGTLWTHQSTGNTNILTAVTWGAGEYIAVGANGTILHSTTGLSWAKSPTGLSQSFLAVGEGTPYAGSPVFVAVGQGGYIFTSADGQAWSLANSRVLLDLNCITTLPSDSSSIATFLAAGAQGIAISSLDGVNWTAITIPSSDDVYAAAGAGTMGALGIYALAGDNGSFMASYNGSAWITPSPGTGNAIRGLVHVDGDFLAVGDGGTIRCGMVWQKENSPTTFNLTSLACGNGIAVAVGNNGTVAVSSDGVNWTPSAAGLQNLNAVAFGGGQFVAVANSLTLWESTNGISWASTTLPNPPGYSSLLGPATLDGAAWNNGTFIASGTFPTQTGFPPQTKPAGMIAVSSNGLPWQYIANPPTASFLGAGTYQAFSGLGLFFVNGGSSLYSSPDGMTWTARLGDQIPACASSSNLIVGLNGALPVQPPVYSSDGTNWNSAATSQTIPNYGIGYGGGNFLAVGSDNGVPCFAVTTNGSSWDSGVFLESGIDAVEFVANRFIAVGTGGVILQSLPAVPAPQLQLVNSPGALSLSVISAPSNSVTVLSSIDLVSWTVWTNFTPNSDVTQFPVTASANAQFFTAAAP